MNKYIFKQLFSNMCCSNCQAEFDEQAINIVRQEHLLCVVQIVCPHCGKSFGLALVGIDSLDIKHNQQVCPFNLDPSSSPPPISYDDVIDAHQFIQKLDHSWAKHIPHNLKKL